MLMRVRELNNEIEIQFTGLGGRQHAVLVALSGTGSDPAQVFDRSKLESLSVRARADGMNVRLRAKSGETLDVSQLYRGLRRVLVESGRTAFVAAAAG
jgi:hypothetical protein